MLRSVKLVVSLTLVLATAVPPGKCRPGQPCWPNQHEINKLSASLNPETSRNLSWLGPPHPVPTWIPAGTLEPLFGVGTNMLPLYTSPVAHPEACLFGGDPNATEFCKMATRDAPREGWQPAFVAWPLNVDHVRKLVKFATKHNLCIAVAGTGGDFNNRHSCDQGMMIRMALMKNKEWDLNDARGFGHPSVRMGPGNTFAEMQYDGSLQTPSVFIAAGWGQSVGVGGWHLGGGHGPFTASKGLGVDNMLEVEIVLANGEVAIANSKTNSDLFWALRGGGGSTWGVITAITSRAHATPVDGITSIGWGTNIGLCGKDTDSVAQELVLALGNLSHRWGLVMDLNMHVEKSSLKNLGCGRRLTGFADFVFLGGQQDPEFQQGHKSLLAGLKQLSIAEGMLPGTSGIVNTTQNWWRHYDTIPIATDQYTTGVDMGSAPFCHETYIVHEADVGKMQERFSKSLQHTGLFETDMIQIYRWQDVNNPMAAPDGATSISPKSRGGKYHLWSPRNSSYGYDDVTDTSYFSESPYEQPYGTWKHRHWGTIYPQLLAVKQRYDPEGVFWCHNCVGSDLHGSAVVLI